MRQHLLADPDAQPAETDTEAGWLRLSSRLTREIGRLADRDDLIVQAAPGAGRGSPGCFVPALASIEVDGRLLPAEVDTARARPRRLSDRERYPVLWGVLSHEAGHARHTRWQAPDGAAVAAATLLEEPRAEACQLGRRPGDRRWLRASATELVLEGAVPDQAVTPWAAAQAAALVLGRVDGGVLDPDEAAPLTAVVEATLGNQRLGELREVWRAALEVADDDADGMLGLGRRWCELVGVDPDGPDPDTDVGTGADGGAGQPAPHHATDTGGRVQGPRSPIAKATRQVLAAVAANDAEEAAAETTAAAAAARRAAAKASEAASRRHAKDAAATVFTPHTYAGTSGTGTPATWTTRPPTPAERAAARRLARQLRAASYRDRATTQVTSQAPPGRLRLRAALAADAQRAAGLRPAAEPWLRTVVVSDGYYTPAQRSGGQARVRHLLATGCGVLWIALRTDPKPLDGAQVALLDDPSVAGVVIGAAARRALRAAP